MGRLARESVCWLIVAALLVPALSTDANAQQNQTSPPAATQTAPGSGSSQGGSTPGSGGSGGSTPSSFSLLPSFQLTPDGEEYELPIQLLLVLTILSLAPAIIILMTSFTRLVVVLSILRTALGTQQAPPNQVIIGLSLFLTLFTMYPVFNTIHDNAVQPYMEGEIGQQVATSQAVDPLKRFMSEQTREKDLLLFMDLAERDGFQNPADIPLHIIVPAFVISELRIAFQIGFMLFLPFLIIDLVVASILMSMGMMMLPPVIISLPIKLLLFVLTDGWYLIVESLLRSYL